MIGVAVIGEKSAATLRLTAEADKFDELRGQISTRSSTASS